MTAPWAGCAGDRRPTAVGVCGTTDVSARPSTGPTQPRHRPRATSTPAHDLHPGRPAGPGRRRAEVAPVVSTSSISDHRCRRPAAHRLAPSAPGRPGSRRRPAASRPTESRAAPAVTRHGATPVGMPVSGQPAGRRPGHRRHRVAATAACGGPPLGAGTNQIVVGEQAESVQPEQTPAERRRRAARAGHVGHVPCRPGSPTGPGRGSGSGPRPAADARHGPVAGSGCCSGNRTRRGRPRRVASHPAHHGSGPPHPGHGRGSTRSMRGRQPARAAMPDRSARTWRTCQHPTAAARPNRTVHNSADQRLGGHELGRRTDGCPDRPSDVGSPPVSSVARRIRASSARP